MTERYVLFDLDGTLTDPAEAITNAIAYAFRELKVDLPPREKLLTFIGPPLSDSFTEFVPREMIPTAIATYRVYFREKGMFENKVYPGIPQLLEELAGRGVPLAVATSKPEEFAITILEHFGLARHFTVIGGADMAGLRGEKDKVIDHVLHQLGNPPPNPTVCRMVGDRKFDILGAKAFGMTGIGVTWGYGSREELISAGARGIADTTDELLQLLMQ